MAINSNSSMPSVQKITVVQYIKPDGTVGFEFQHAEARHVDPQGNLEMLKVTPVVTMACGHVWPSSQPFGMCTMCVRNGLANPLLCRDDCHRCLDCGLCFCPHHSFVAPDENNDKGRLCEACFLIRKHRWLIHTVKTWLKSHL